MSMSTDDDMDMMAFDDTETAPTNASCSPYDSRSYAVVAAVSAGLAFLSIVLILGVIGIIILFKKWRYFIQRLILYTSITALFVNVAIVLHRVDYENQVSEFYENFCEFGGYLDLTSNWMLLVAVSAIIAHCFSIIFFDKNTEKYEPVYIFAIFGFPLLITWIPFIKNSYGRAGAWCWIRSKDRQTCEPFTLGSWLQFLLWFAPLYFIMFALIVLYVLILIKIYQTGKKKGNQPQESTQKKDILSLIAYPLIYFLLNVFPFVNRTYNSVHEEPNLVLWYFAALANPSVGAWIALAFTLDPGTRKRLTYANIQAAVRDLLGREEPVKEYNIDTETSIRSESYHQSNPTQPYKSYEDCYRLNLSTTRST